MRGGIRGIIEVVAVCAWVAVFFCKVKGNMQRPVAYLVKYTKFTKKSCDGVKHIISGRLKEKGPVISLIEKNSLNL